MNIQEFIKSGIIEAYVFGLASVEEIEIMETYLPIYPELRHALGDFELKLETFSMNRGVPPPNDLESKIRARLLQLPAVKPTYKQTKGNGQKEDPPINDYLPVKTTSSFIQVHKFWRVAFFTVFVISKILLVLFIYFLIKYQNARAELLILQGKTVPTVSAPAIPGK
ncbi:hypothetical protein ACX0G9_17060 [Flavitalea flava]